ncbi:PHB depolymerase family esterase [Bradyrhizobium sp. AUGA SZCCT0222]|uniref:extracellular catalytic domain type 1 short-chain-length polyhydroxyalkanoate depolymerase n=1 Tax=Bradyrhizobium sp. AUGA SZCCT0222 TaxID=2807668 RepID=UPI001BA9755B|nr:PHB depolymerase family esterase [Bradyrhizobium sp. AUGA SZCCT0222]MBR1271932.1 PHB depolymerase family esterase [Bradyrhizobium sp. AUGA SZCCT0222]
MLNQDTLREATRLTQAGQLAEATALLQRMLRGDRAPDAHSRTPGRIALPGSEPPTVDAKANDREETGGAHLTQATPFSSPRLQPLFRRAKDGSWLGMRGAKRTPPSALDIAPEGTKFMEAVYSNPAGSRAYKLFIPSGYRGQPLPLIVMLHGCTQSPDEFAAGTRMNFMAEEQTCFVVYPEQRSDANQSKCWNWFRTADQQRGGGEPSLIAGITRQVMRDYSVDPKRVYVGGLSAGAAAAAIMGAAYNDLYAAVGIHSGLACGAATDMPSAFAAMRQGGGHGRRVISCNAPPVPAIIFHGDRDTTVHPSNAGQVVEQAIGQTSTQIALHRGQIPGGHAYSRTTHTDADARKILEYWNIHGAGHAWSGGSPAGSYTDPRGPDATREMLRFFLDHSLPAK